MACIVAGGLSGYRGVSGVVDGATSTQQESPVHAGSLLAVNGLRVLPILAIPVALSGLGLLSLSVLRRYGYSRGRLTLRLSAALLAVGVFLAMFSVGIFYLPSAISLGIAAGIAPKMAIPDPR